VVAHGSAAKELSRLAESGEERKPATLLPFPNIARIF
jgi:hypothetical protein